jgi:arginyl-tRNA synthetase
MIEAKIREWLGGQAKVEPTGDLAHGDYTSNIAIVTKQDANQLKQELESRLLPEIEQIEVAGPGFLNFFLKPEYLKQNVDEVLEQREKYGWGEEFRGQKTMVEYTDPNPFKEFHIGHLMSNAIGESISRLIESGGAEVKRACYQGDVGLHVAKAVWAKGDYVAGAKAYESDEQAKTEIQEVNQKLYQHSDPELEQIYQEGRQKSLEKFEEIYRRLGTRFDFNFFESAMVEPGLKIVREHQSDGVFEESEGAIVFKGEKFNPKLHTRVYITKQGLATYETKELGLHFAKYQQLPFDQSIVITANEQDGVFKVGLEALKQINPDLAAKTKHLSHGMLRLPTGKMSSRTGDVITAESLLATLGENVKEKNADAPIDAIAVGAIKFEILKQAPGRDIIFDQQKALSLEGDSGPYLQYTGARAHSILGKSDKTPDATDLETNEVSRLLTRYPGVVSRAREALAPQLVLNYLLKLAGAFNAYYANNKIIGSPEEASRLALTAAVRQVLANGLWLLGIAAPEQM